MADAEEVLTKFQAVEEWQRQKIRHICSALSSDPVDIALLRRQASTKGGLLCAEMRKRAWPKLVGVNIYNIPHCPYLEHRDKKQVILDVRRCGRRLPKELTDEDRDTIQDQMTRVILRLLVTHSDLCYYQGLHDMVLTFLLLPLDENVTFAVMDVLVRYHIRDFLDADIKRTKVVMNYVRPLLSLTDPDLERFITQSECEYYFSLSWILTWYSHVIDSREDLLTLTDHFLASHPLMPIYVTTVLICSRKNEVLAQDCEMSSVHGFLSKFPEDLRVHVDELVQDSQRLFEKFPPLKVAHKGRLRLSESIMNDTHSAFLSKLKGQRPDRVLAVNPHAPPITSWLDFVMNLSLNIAWYSLPILVGVATYWWLDRKQTLLSIEW